MTGKPLSGVRVLDFTALLPGAICTMQLADMGADVLKIEPPVTGDGARGPAGSPPSGFFLITNRNKRSLTLNLKHPEAKGIVLALAAQADVLVEGFRPGVMARLGLDHAAVSAANARIVYCSITGYGQNGPLAAMGGHDTNYQSYAGVMGQNVIDGSRPSPGNFPIADLAGGGLSSAMGILAALFDAQRSGKGRYIDVSMTDCAMALNVAPLAGKYSFGGTTPPPGGDFLSGALPCYRSYETSDGRHLAFGALEFKFWRAFCKAVDRSDLEPRGWDMGEMYAATVAEISAVVAGRSFAEWCELLVGVDACVTPVLNLDEAMAHPNTKARGMAIAVPAGGAIDTQYAFPLKMSDFAFAVERLPPALGEHNREVLASLGHSDAEIARMQESGLL